MPLLNLKTNLKSLKYGQDQPGGGDSGQPYIKTDINTVDTDFNRLRLTKFDDGLIRGGVIGATNASVVDTLRIGKFFLDAPKGPLFIVKQVGLQFTNPRLETKKLALLPPGKGILNAVGNAVINVANTLNNTFGPTRIYNLGFNTLAQVPLNAFGGHIVRHGLLPIQTEDSKYEAVVRNNNSGNSKNNRLVGLISELGLKEFKIKSIKQPTTTTAEGGSLIRGFMGSNDINFQRRQALGLVEGGGEDRMLAEVIVERSTKSKIEIGGIISSLSYFGGPGSVYGIGFTNIRRSIITNSSSKEAKDDAKAYTTNLSRILGREVSSDNSYRLTAADIGLSVDDSRLRKFVDQNLPDYDPDNASSIRDFTAIKYTSVQPSLRKYSELISAIDKVTSGSVSYRYEDSSLKASSLVDKQRTIGEQLPTSNSEPVTYKNTYGETVTISGSWNRITREKRVGSGRQDSINLTPLFTAPAGQDSLAVNIGGTSYTINDLAKFRIQAIDTDSPSQGTFMIFRAYLTDLSDDVSAEWSDVKYAGRGDRFYIYNGFTRKMSIGFKVAALSSTEMQPMYQKLNYLMSNLMPDYRNSLMRGPLVRMTVGNYIDSQLGILTSLNYKISQDTPWEIALNEPTVVGGIREMVLPHIIEVSLGFTPIGSQTWTSNELSRKANYITHVAQNYNGASEKSNYITPGDILNLKPGTPTVIK